MRLVSWCTFLLSTRSATGYVLKPISGHNVELNRSPPAHHLITTAPPSRRSTRIGHALHAAKANNNRPADDDTTEMTPEPPPEKWLLTLVVPLWLVYISNQWSRSSIYYLVDFSPTTATATTAMNVALDMDESQYAILASVAFTSLFAVASVVLGNAVDQPSFDRKKWTILSCLIWSAAVVVTATADSYPPVLAARIGMGIACAVTTPTAYTWIRDVAPSATATSIYGTGVAVGSAAASLTLLLDTQVGWRSALMVIAATGVGAAVLAAVVLPDDDDDDGTAMVMINDESSDAAVDTAAAVSSPGLWDSVQQAFASERAQWIFLACLFRFSSGLCIGVWSAPFFRAVLSAENVSQYAVAQAVISAVGASVSGILGGRIADRLSSGSDEAGGAGVEQRLWVPVVGSLLAAPAWYFAVETAPESFGFSMTWLAVEYLVAECWFGPTISTLQATVGPAVGGTAQGLFTMTGAVANLAPTVVGYLLADNLSDLLSESVCFGYVASAACFAMAIRAAPPTSIDDP